MAVTEVELNEVDKSMLSKWMHRRGLPTSTRQAQDKIHSYLECLGIEVVDGLFFFVSACRRLGG